MQDVIVILGTTASGKGALARALAQSIDAEIVSMDSMKVYRGMDIGTAKPPPEIRRTLPHHLIDIVDPWESFSAARWVELADAAIEQIHQHGRPAIVVGGTMLYFKCFHDGMFAGPPADNAFRAALRTRAAAEGLETLHAELARVDPEAAARISTHDYRRIERALEVHHLTGQPISTLQAQWSRGGPRRTDWRWTLIALRRDKDDASRRTNARVRRMIDAGLVDEARRLFAHPRGIGPQARQAVGYRELFDHFAGKCTLEDAIEQIKIDTRRLAKQQRTWLKRTPGLYWIDLAPGQPGETALEAANAALPQNPPPRPPTAS